MKKVKKQQKKKKEKVYKTPTDRYKLRGLSKFNYFKIAHVIKDEYEMPYSIGLFIAQLLFLVGAVMALGWSFKLKANYIILAGLVTLVLTPITIKAMYDIRYSFKRFDMISDYLTNIVPIFTRKTKILDTLKDVEDMCNGKMKYKVQEAIDYIINVPNDPNLLVNGLGIIEKEFPNSRVKAVHRMMITIETVDSQHARESCEQLFADVENYINRTYSFIKDIKDRRNKLLIINGMTILLDWIFVYLYSSNELFEPLLEDSTFQFMTLAFLLSIVIISVIVYTKLHGQWMVNDIPTDEEVVYNEKVYEYLQHPSKKIKPGNIIMSVIFIAVGFVLYLVLDTWFVLLPFIIISIMLFFKTFLDNGTKHKKIKKLLQQEFPVWLRDVSLAMYYHTVFNSFEKAKMTASYPMAREVDKFLRNVEVDPITIKPFTSFLTGYQTNDIQATMKVMYSIQTLGRSEMETQINALNERNQKMLDKSEIMRNEDKLSGVNVLGYIPMVIFSVQLVISMFLLMNVLMTTIGSYM